MFRKEFSTAETLEELKAIYKRLAMENHPDKNELLKMAGIKIEIIGCFIWVSGDTKPHREELKKIGFKWHSKKQNWYKHPAGYKKKSKKRYSMDEVRDMFGVRYEAETETAKALPA